MESLYIKEKKLQSVLEKLKNLSYLPNAHTQEVDKILVEKNQLQSEKIEIERISFSLFLRFRWFSPSSHGSNYEHEAHFCCSRSNQGSY